MDGSSKGRVSKAGGPEGDVLETLAGGMNISPFLVRRIPIMDASANCGHREERQQTGAGRRDAYKIGAGAEISCK